MRDRPLLPEGAQGALSLRRADTGHHVVLVGGFPCQGLSVAGRSRDLVGPSALWFEFKRAILEVQPEWVVIENVGHTWRRWVPSVRRDLASLGLASLPIRVRACDLGSPHERARIFIVAHSNGEHLRKLSRWWCGPGREVAKELGWAWDSAPRRQGKDDGFPNWVDARRALGNAAVVPIVQVIAKGIKVISETTQQVTHEDA